MVAASWCDLTIGGKQILFEDEITSVRFTDKAGHRSDQITINVLPNVPRPNAEDKVTCVLYNDVGEVLECGLFHVQSTTRSQNKALSFAATGVEFTKKQKNKLSQNYEATTLSGVVSLIAGRLGKEVNFKLTDIPIISLYQTDETDLQFLDRLATQYDALFSIKNDVLYFVSKNTDSLPLYKVNAEACSSISVKRSTKTQYSSCEVTYYDKNIADQIKVKVDAGEPVLKISCPSKTQEEATQKGKATLAKAQRGTISGSLTVVGQKLYAGTKMELYNTYKGEDDGIYSVESVTHTYSRKNGWIMSVEFENFKLIKKA